ncbi:hypothetical protein TURU_056432 [Turdus rufiventris]|nr:hypothetical protein TURU_056432 [Turdus rufiventris]
MWKSDITEFSSPFLVSNMIRNIFSYAYQQHRLKGKTEEKKKEKRREEKRREEKRREEKRREEKRREEKRRGTIISDQT